MKITEYEVGNINILTSGITIRHVICGKQNISANVMKGIF